MLWQSRASFIASCISRCGVGNVIGRASHLVFGRLASLEVVDGVPQLSPSRPANSGRSAPATPTNSTMSGLRSATAWVTSMAAPALPGPIWGESDSPVNMQPCNFAHRVKRARGTFVGLDCGQVGLDRLEFEVKCREHKCPELLRGSHDAVERFGQSLASDAVLFQELARRLRSSVRRACPRLQTLSNLTSRVRLVGTSLGPSRRPGRVLMRRFSFNARASVRHSG